MDFYRIKERSTKSGVLEIYPDFTVKRSQDLMVKAKSFYAIWDERKGLWSTDEYDVQRLVDEQLYEHMEKKRLQTDGSVQVKFMADYSSNSWKQFRSYLAQLSDSAHELDTKLTFANTEIKKDDYVSKRLPYDLSDGDYSAYDELISTLYDPSERAKLEWAIGSVLSGDSKHIQKFVVLYGPAGAGKSTVLNIIQRLFEGYYAAFEAKALTSSSNAFSTEVFKTNPLVAIQHDGDLSNIEDNTKLNSIVSHEEMTINEKYKPSYTSRINAFLFMGTNKPVKITDAKSGIIRRLIDVQPSGRRLSSTRYHTLMSQINFELGAIANHCLETYLKMGKNYYSTYRPVEMMLQTDVFYNYIESYFEFFKNEPGVSLSQAYEMYKQFCSDSSIDYVLPLHRFREELKNYFKDFATRETIDGVRIRSWYSGFQSDKFAIKIDEAPAASLTMDKESPLLENALADCPAQYANSVGTPKVRWVEVNTTLSDLDTTKLHFVKVPENHIVIDFDMKDREGRKDAEKNIEEASKWPPTYAEFSKSGGGVHLHYIYTGDPSKLKNLYAEDIEIKVFRGDASLRRIKTRNNGLPIAKIIDGLPLKEDKVITAEQVKSERSLRIQIERNLNKEIHPGTKPSMDFIKKILDDAYESDLVYDLTDMTPRLITFAANSTNQSAYCLAIINKLKLASEEKAEKEEVNSQKGITFFDVEVFPNLFIVSWKYAGDDTSVVSLVNPKPHMIEELLSHNLVGFNNKRYDNHILYAAFMGYDNLQLYNLSQKIINGEGRGGLFREAYGLSYTDIYDFSSKKQGLKKFQIELGIRHKELGLPWDQPVPEDMWNKVVEYCENDVVTTEKVFEARRQDFVAREILADLSGLSLNSSTQQHTAKIIFGSDKNHKDQFVYTDLSKEFEGYTYENGESKYRGEVTGEGGYVYSEPGYYEDVAVLDIASMHPTTMQELNMFGKYTKNLTQLINARLAIKHGEYESAKKMLNGALAPHLEDESQAADLSYALKIVINIIYGLTAAKFDNPFRDVRNKDNIVAKRGALFMIDLKHAVQEQGYQVVHIKTDSIKIPNATTEIIEFVMEYGREYGYNFEHEVTYEKFCLVNNAVYIAKTKQGKRPPYWEAVGAQFQHRYVYKWLFSHEEIEFEDLCETKAVTTAMYLDMDADTPMYKVDEKGGGLVFVGQVGSFVPIKQGHGGGILLRKKDEKYHAVAGTTGYFWLEAEKARFVDDLNDHIDYSYFETLVHEAKEKINEYTDVDKFTSEQKVRQS